MMVVLLLHRVAAAVDTVFLHPVGQKDAAGGEQPDVESRNAVGEQQQERGGAVSSGSGSRCDGAAPSAGPAGEAEAAAGVVLPTQHDSRQHNINQAVPQAVHEELPVLGLEALPAVLRERIGRFVGPAGTWTTRTISPPLSGVKKIFFVSLSAALLWDLAEATHSQDLWTRRWDVPLSAHSTSAVHYEEQLPATCRVLETLERVAEKGGAVKGNVELIAAVLSLLCSDCGGVRMRAVRALGEIAEKGDRQILTAISAQLAGAYWYDRTIAVRALARLARQTDDKEVIAAILGQLGDGHLTVREEAVRGLGEIGGKENKEVIAAISNRGLADEYWTVRRAAVSALAQIGADENDDVIRLIKNHLADDWIHVRDEAVGALAQIADRLLDCPPGEECPSVDPERPSRLSSLVIILNALQQQKLAEHPSTAPRNCDSFHNIISRESRQVRDAAMDRIGARLDVAWPWRRRGRRIQMARKFVFERLSWAVPLAVVIYRYLEIFSRT